MAGKLKKAVQKKLVRKKRQVKHKPAKRKKSLQKKKAAKRVSIFRPGGYHTLTPYLSVHDGNAAVDYYTKAFGAKEKAGRMSGPDGKIMHTEIKIGDSYFMLADESSEMGNVSPKTQGKTTVQFLIYVKNADAVMKQAVAAGGVMLKPVELQFYGDRSGRLEDPFGYTWFIATHVEDVSPKEMVKRAAALYGG
ncbi:VOC family protein [bacterium]|nr:VOC family protein [bacterium]